VARLLDEEIFAGTLVAGGSGIAGMVTWCLPLTEAVPGTATCEEFADAAVHVPPEALAGTGAEVVERLAQWGSSMLVVPTSPARATEDLAEAIEAADRVGIPMLAAGPHATFRETSQLIATKVLAQATHVLEYGTRVHRMLGDVFARGAGLSALAQAMAEVSGTTVLVVGNNAEPLAVVAPRKTDQELSAAAVERIIEAVTTPGLAQAEVETGDHHVETTTLDVEGDTMKLVHAPVRVAGEPFGLLVVVETRHPCPEHDLAQHRVLVEQGVSLTGSELLRMRSVRQAEERARNDFAHALLHARFTDEVELAARAEHYGLPVDGRFAVYVVTTAAINPDTDSARRVGREVERAVQAIATPDLFTLTATIGAKVVVVRQLRKRRGSDRDADQVTTELQSFGERLRRSLEPRVEAEVRVAYGRPFNGAPGIAKSYREARTAEGLGRRVQTPPVCSYTELRVFAAIEECAMTSSGRDFAAEVLAPLRQLDGQTGNLEELVLAYIEEGGNLNATARRLHLHRNTMLYKLERASRALNMDVRTTEAQFMIWFAHHITALNDVLTSLDRELAPPT
jgi:sugar diacid utilization regulator